MLARGSLSVAEPSMTAHRDYAVGTYAPESTPGGGEFRWTRADARISLRTRSRVAVLRSWVAHPDAAVRPVTLRIATPCQEILVEELHNERLVSLALELPDDGPLVLLTHVSRTWRPSDYGESIPGNSVRAWRLTSWRASPQLPTSTAASRSCRARLRPTGL